MQKVTTKAMAKVAAVATGLAMATSMLSLAPMAHAAALTDAQVSSILSLLTSFGADSATIANVQASLTGGTPTGTTGGGSMASSCAFTKDLTVKSSGSEVTCLQQALIAGGYSIPAGATGYFGSQTVAAVIAWQKAAGVTPSVGYFGAKSRAAFNLGGGSTGTTGGTTGGVSAGTGNGLKVMLASDSPNGLALVQGQAVGTLAKFTFANPTSADIKVTNVGFKRIGVSNDATLVNVYLYSGAKRLTDSAGVSSSAFNFNDSTGIFTVPAGGTYTVSVTADILSTANGQQIGAQLVSVSSTGTLDSSVSFPVTGGLQTVSAATLATVDFGGTTPSVSSVNPQNDYTVWQNTITVGTRAVKLASFQLKNIGSIKTSDVNNLRLYVDGVQVGSAATLASDNTVTWDLSASPKQLETGGRVVKVVGDIVGGSSLTFKFSLQRASDAQMIDTDLNQPVLATAGGTAFSARSATSATIASGTVSVTKAAASPSSNVSLGATNVKFATFELRAAGEDVKVDNLNVRADTTLDHGLDNGKVFLNGVQVGSTKDLTDATEVNFTFGSSLILKAGTVAVVDIYADAKTSTGAAFADGDTAVVRLSDMTGTDNGTGVTSLSAVQVPSANVPGNTITISSSSVTLTKYSGYGNQTLVAGSQNAKMGSFTLSTGSTEGVNVNTITVTLSTAESATITDLTLKDHATGAQIGTAKASPSQTNSFSLNLNIAPSTTQVIDVYANIKSGAEAGPWAANIDGSGTGATTGSAVTFGHATNSTATLQTITVGNAVLTPAVNTGATPNAANVIAGASSVKVGSFSFTAQYSPFTVTAIKVKVPNGASTSVTAVTLKYKDANGASKETSASLSLPSTTAQYATATFTGLTMNVPANDSANLDVYVGIPTVASGATSGAAISVVLDSTDVSGGYAATDSAGNTDNTLGSELASNATTGKGTMYVRKSIPTLSKVSLDSTALSAGTLKPIGRVNIAADAAGDVSWDKIVFAVTKSSTVTLGATTSLAVYNGSNAVSGRFATTTGDSLNSDTFGAATSGNIIFVPDVEQQVAAGGSATYELRATVGGTWTNYTYLNVSIANPNSTSITTDTFATVADTATAPLGAASKGFVWSDRSSISTVHGLGTSDWTNDYLVSALPLDLGTVSGTF